MKKSPQPPQPSPRIEVPPAEHYAPPAEDYAQLAEHYARPFERYARQLAAVTRPGVTFRKKQIMSRDEFDLFCAAMTVIGQPKPCGPGHHGHWIDQSKRTGRRGCAR